jgi:hypothetical protein
MKKFVDEQQEENCKALLHCGQYRLRDEYHHLAIPPSRWFTALTDKQKRDARKKFQCCSVDDMQTSTMVASIRDRADSAKELSVQVQVAVDVTGLPTLVLRQLWAKASDLLTSTGHILPAPGSCSASRMVASLTHKKPHFVSQSCDGRFECDSECQAFSQRYICSHSVATAEDNGMLKEFLESYAKFSKTPKGSRSIAPNFTRLSMSNLPRGTAGQKGAKAPKKKAVNRRNTVATEYRRPLELNLDKGNKSRDKPQEPQVSVDSVSGSLNVITSSSGGNFNWMNSHYQPSYPFSMYYPPPPPLPVNFSDYYDPYGMSSSYQSPQCTGTHASSSYQSPQCTGTHASSSYQSPHSASSSLQSSDNSMATVTTSERPFLVKFLNGRIKVCAGCRGPYPKGINDEVLPPPHDICIVHSEPLTFTNPRTGLESSKVGNAHYHVNQACIRKKHPKFTARFLSCPENMMKLLLPCHFKFLLEAVGFKP